MKFHLYVPIETGDTAQARAKDNVRPLRRCSPTEWHESVAGAHSEVYLFSLKCHGCIPNVHFSHTGCFNVELLEKATCGAAYRSHAAMTQAWHRAGNFKKDPTRYFYIHYSTFIKMLVLAMKFNTLSYAPIKSMPPLCP